MQYVDIPPIPSLHETMCDCRFCDFMTEDQMLVALEMGQNAISTACKQIGEWVAKVISMAGMMYRNAFL